MKRWIAASFAGAIVFASAAAAGIACDIVPWPHRHDLKAINLIKQVMDVKIKDQVAEVTIDATFHNPNQVVVEGMYFTNLPAGAQVKDFSMTVNGNETKGELLDSQKARQIYNEIVNKRRDPAILELIGQQMLKCSIYPINPDSDVKVRIVYTQLLAQDGGLVQFQAPFAHNVSNDRPVDSAVLTLSIESKIPIKAIYSPTHNIDIARKDDHHAKASYEAKSYSTRKDFVLYYALSDKEVGVNLHTYREAGENGYFILMASPKFEVDESAILPKDILFVFDRSGSMSGEKMRQGQEAITYCLNSLKPTDRFNIIDFSSEVNAFDPKIQEASKENLTRAKKYVEKLRAAGSTNIDDALQTALAMLANDPKRVRMVLFITDGTPTVGEQNPDKIIANVARKNENASLCRIFVFGVGNDVNTLFLDKLAEANHGARDYVQPEEKIEAKVSSLFEKVSSPVLSGLSIDFGGVKTLDSYPRAIPDLFKGTQLTLFGRYTGSGKTVINLRGTAADQEKLFRFEVNFPENGIENDFIPRLWAGRKVAYLVDSIRLHGNPSKEVIDEIVSLGKKYGIMTPYTSFLVTEEGDAETGVRRMREELDKGHDRAKHSGGGNAPETKKAQAESKELEAQKAEPSQDKDEKMAGEYLKKAKEGGRKSSVEDIKYVGSKVFYLRGGIWIDGAYDPEKMKDKIKRVTFLTEEYLKLIDAHPGIQKYLAIGDRLILVYDALILQVDRPGTEK